MNQKIRNIRRNVASKQRVFGNLFLVVILIISSFATFYIVPQTKIKTVRASGISYYISSSDGSDTYDGLSPSTPWQNMSKLNTEMNEGGGGVINDGDDIYFKCGDVWRNSACQVGLRTASGTSDSDTMIFGSYGTGAKPIIDDLGGDLFQLVNGNTGWWVFENLTLVGTDDAIIMNAGNTYNLTIRNCNITGDVELHDCQSVLIEDCYFFDGVAGQLTGAGSPSVNTVIRNTVIDAQNNGSDCYQYHYGGDETDSIGANHIIINCTFVNATENAIDLAGGGDCDNIYIRNCTWYNTNGAGCSVAHETENTLIENCRVIGDSIFFTESNKTIVRNSVIDRATSFPIGAGTVQFSSAGPDIARIYIYNNFIRIDSGASSFIELNNNENQDVDEFDILRVRNNIFYTTFDASNFVTYEPDGSGQWNLTNTNSNYSHNCWYDSIDDDYTDASLFDLEDDDHTFAEWSALVEVDGDITGDPEVFNAEGSNFPDDWYLNDTSQCIDTGVFLTETVDAGTGTRINVTDAGYFFAGVDIPGIETVNGDLIFIGGDENLEVIEVDHINNTLIIDQSITWAEGEDVSLMGYQGNAPDIGAYEFPQAEDPDPGTNYYVSDSDGNDGDSGLTPADAWATIGKVVSEYGGDISEGDNIYFNRGDSFDDATFTLPTSGGTSDNPMIIGAYGEGAKPKFDRGAGSQIYVNNAIDNITFQSINVTDGGASYAINFEAGSNAHNIRFTDVEVFTHQFIIRDTNGYTIENCVFSPCSTGAHGLCIGEGATNGVVRNCIINTQSKDGINFHFDADDTTEGECVGSNHYFENITISGATGDNGIDAVGGMYSRNVMFRNISVTNSGFCSVGHEQYDVFFDNVSIYNSRAGGLSISDPHNFTMRNCIIKNWSVVTADKNGITTDIGQWSPYETGDCTIYNNNIITDGDADHIQFNSPGLKNITFTNNIFFSTAYASPGRFVYAIPPSTFAGINTSWRTNMWWRGDNGAGDETWWTDDDDSFTLAEWNAKDIVEDDVRDDPEFGDVVGNDFTLNSTSPAIDGGTWLTKTDDSGTGTVISLRNANFFFAGLKEIGVYPYENVSGDNIFIGDDADLEVVAVDYFTNNITVNRSITWTAGESVSLSDYSGSAPDIGAFESEYGGAYYVSNSTGDDSYDGLTPETAWQNISKVTTEMNGGVITEGKDVYFNRGDVFEGAELLVRQGGNSGDWMIIGAYGTGNRPIFSGIDGDEGATIQIHESGIGHIAIQDLYINNAEVGLRASQNALDNITLENFVVESPSGNGIVITGCDHLIMENVYVGNATGGAGIVIYGRDAGNANQNTKALNCTVAFADSDGFTYHQSDGAGTDIGENHYLYNCKAYGITSEQGFDMTSGHNIYMKDCESYANNNGGMTVGHNSENVTIDNFYMHDEDDEGIILSSTDNCRIRNSIFHNINSYALDHTVGLPVDYLCVYNNDFLLETGNGKATRFATADMSKIYFKNNIFYVNNTDWASQYIQINDAMDDIPFNSTNNMFYRQGDLNTTDRFVVNAVNRNWNEWIAYTETWNDTNWLFPSICDVSSGLFNLTDNSYAIDAGDWLTYCVGGDTGTVITVNISNYFFPGLSTLNINGDNIFVGDDTDLEVIDVDYPSDTITVNRSITWIDGDNIGFSNFLGDAPDIGAEEAEEGEDGGDESSWQTIIEWNGTIYNISQTFNVVSDWNGSIYNESESFVTLQEWNGTVYNTSSTYSINVTLSVENTTYTEGVDTYINISNGTLVGEVYDGVGGYSSSTYTSTSNDIRGSVYTTGDIGGTADNMTAYIRSNAAGDAAMAIYLNSTKELIGYTEESALGANANNRFVTFDFSEPKPTLEANTDYLLVWWNSGEGMRLFYQAGTGWGFKDDLVYNYPAWSDPVEVDTELSGYSYYIYCNYTAEETGNTSYINNTGDSNETVYMDMKFEYNNSGTWVEDTLVIDNQLIYVNYTGNEVPHYIAKYWNGSATVSQLSYGSGEYRINATLYDAPEGDPIVNAGGSSAYEVASFLFDGESVSSISTSSVSTPIVFNSGTAINWSVNATGQSDGVYALTITNDGDLPVTIKAKLDNITGDDIHLKYDTSYSPPSFLNDSSHDGFISVGIYSFANSEVTTVHARNGTVAWYWNEIYGDDKVFTSPSFWNDTIYIGTCDVLNHYGYFAINSTWENIVLHANRVRWETNIENNADVYTSLSIANGYVYTGAKEIHNVSCLDAETGEFIWNYTLGDTFYCQQPAIADGILLVCVDDWNLYAFGDLAQWNKTQTTHPDYDGSDHANWDMFGRNNTGWAQAVDCDFSPINNTLLWTANCTGTWDEFSSPVVHDGIVYVCAKNYTGEAGYNKTFAFHLNNGTEIWNTTTADIIHDGSPFYSNGLVFVQSISQSTGVGAEDYLTCLYANNGTIKWQFRLERGIDSYGGGPTVSEDEGLVFAKNDGILFAVYISNGTQKWNATIDNTGVATTPLYHNGYVYTMTYDNGMFCHDAYNGTEIWHLAYGLTPSTQIANGWDSSPMIYGMNESYSCANEIKEDFSTILATDLPASSSINLYLWADFDNSSFEATINNTLNITAWNNTDVTFADVPLQFNYPSASAEEEESRDWQTVQEWDGSIYNQTYYETVFDWNGTIYNTTALDWIEILNWNGTIYNLTYYNTLYDWNGTVYNVTYYDALFNWNGTVYNTSSEAPTVIINFAGNLSDYGGPYWRPPDETVALSGIWYDGYYTNASHQQEDWIYINCTIENVTGAYLDWLNETTWTNGTYALVNTDGNFWEINTSGNITVSPNYDYSFNINASNGSTNTIYPWNKTGIDGVYTRRYVQLNSTVVNITYQPFYMSKANYEDIIIDDRLHHDQGDAGSKTDTGYLTGNVPTNTVQQLYCLSGVGSWFDNNTCIEPFNLNNTYFHFWYSSDDEADVTFGWQEIRRYQTAAYNDSYSSGSGNAKSQIYYNGLTANDLFYLEAELLSMNPTIPFTDNDIFESTFKFYDGLAHPSMISNRSFTSFVIFNVPDNETLNTSYVDTDSDGLSDWHELYVSYTNPFLSDTDNDSRTDYEEANDGTDPNNYTDYILGGLRNWYEMFSWNGTIYNATSEWQAITAWNGTIYNTTYINTSVDEIEPYIQYDSPLQINATSYGTEPDNVSLWYRYSPNNVSWGNNSQNWFNTSFDYRKLLTIDKDNINEQLTNFPVFLNLTIGMPYHAQEGGKDFLFVSYNNITQYNHEIESYSTTSGILNAWVNVTSISSTEDTHFWMYYGNSTCTSQENITGTWDGYYTGVWHMDEGATDNQNDSSRYDNDALFSDNGVDNTLVTGIVGDCIQFNDGNDYYETASDDSLNTTEQVTFSSWIYVDAFHSYEEWFTKDSDWYIMTRDDEVVNGIATYAGDKSSRRYNNNDATWFYITVTVNSTGFFRIYIDGGLANTTSGTTLTNLVRAVGIGKRREDGRQPSGKMDECRVSNATRNSSWVNASYKTMIDPASFTTSSAEEEYSGEEVLGCTWRFFETDTTTPWYWFFDFVNGTGYYEFYSIGNITGMENESAPLTADSECYYDNYSWSALSSWNGTIYNGSIVSNFSCDGFSYPWNVTFTGDKSNATDTQPYLVWCNNTGIAFETIKITVNNTKYIEFSNYPFINDTAPDINTSNVTLLVSIDNITFEPLEDNTYGLGYGVYPDGGGSLMWNFSTSPAGINPFMYYGDGENITTESDLYVRWMLNITSSATEGIYHNNTHNWIAVYNWTWDVLGSVYYPWLLNVTETPYINIKYVFESYDVTTPNWQVYNFSSLSQCMTMARNNDTVYIFEGNYNDNPVINHTVTIIGNSTTNTTIDGGLLTWGLNITSDYVNVSGLSIRDAGYSIICSGEHVLIDDCNITTPIQDGIRIKSNYVSVNNTIVNASAGLHGIYMRSCNYNNITNSSVLSPGNTGLLIAYSEYNNLYNVSINGTVPVSLLEVNCSNFDNITAVGLGGVEGFTINECSYNVFTNMTIVGDFMDTSVRLYNGANYNNFTNVSFSTSSFPSICLNISDSSHNIISGSSFFESSLFDCILTGDSDSNLLHDNSLTNFVYVEDPNCDYNVFWNNTIGEQYDDYGTNTVWYNITLQRGNWWSNYTERYPLAISNGVYWDIPYDIPVSLAQDLYPLAVVGFNGIISWNGTIYNASERDWSAILNWNGTVYNISYWNEVNQWNGTIYNVSYRNTKYVFEGYDATTPDWQVYNFSNLQDCMNVTNNNDTIYVFEGDYTGNVSVNRTVTIIGNSTINTTINGTDSAPWHHWGFNITNDFVNISGFRITAVEPIVIWANHTNIDSCDINISVDNGIIVRGDYNSINNIVINESAFSATGISIVSGNYTNITNCTVNDMWLCGVGLSRSDYAIINNVTVNGTTMIESVVLCYSNYSSFSNMNVTADTNGLSIGEESSYNSFINIVISTSGPGNCIFEKELSCYNNFSNISITSSGGVGFNLSDSSHNIINDSTFIGTTSFPVLLTDDSDSNLFFDNIIEDFIYVEDAGCNDNVFWNNTISEQKADYGTNTIWYNATLQRGNLWGNYTQRYPEATTTNNIYWNTPYDIPVSLAQDLYPLVTVSFKNTTTWNGTIYNNSLPEMWYSLFDYNGTIYNVSNVIVTTNASTNVSYNYANLNGYLEAGGNCQVKFEYGLTASYGSETPTTNRSEGEEFEGVHEQYTTGDDLSSTIWPHWFVQTFTVGAENDNETFNMTAFRIKAYTSGAYPQFNLYITSVADDGTIDGLLYGPDTYTTNHMVIANPGDWYQFNLTEPFTLEQGEQYGLGLIGNGDIYWRGKNVGGYTGGCQVIDWTTLTARDSMFEIIGRWVGSNVTDLLPDTTYHYRANGTSGSYTHEGTDMSFHTESALDMWTPTTIEETTTDLKGHLLYDVGEDTTCGFWISTVSPVNSTNFEQNISCDGTFNTGEFFEKTATGLTKGEYYHVRSWMNNARGFWNSSVSSEQVFLTKPDTPSNFEVEPLGPGSIALSWTNATVGSGTNLSTIVRYKEGTPPTTLSDGYLACNISAYSNYTLNGLDFDTTYGFSAWTYINDTGSPLLWQVSDGYDTTFGTTTGGHYNFTVRYENTSYKPVPLTNGEWHKFIVHYANRTEYNLWNATDLYYNETNMSAISANGTFSCNLLYTPLFFEFYWNDTTNNTYSCKRILVVEGTADNVSIFVRTDLVTYGMTETIVLKSQTSASGLPGGPIVIDLEYPLDSISAVYVYNISTFAWMQVPNDKYSVVGNSVSIDLTFVDDNITLGRVDYYTKTIVYGADDIEGTIVRYTYSFIDETGLFKLPNNPLAVIYAYDSEGNKMIIHSEYFDTSLQIYPWLVYGKEYYIGVYCDVLSIDKLGLCPTKGVTTEEEIVIPYTTNESFNFFDFAYLDVGWYANGFYVHYHDTTFSTTNVSFMVYHFYNGTLVHNETSTLSDKNFTYTVAEGCNLSLSYKAIIIATINDTEKRGTYEVSYISLIPGMEPITNASSINDLIELIFGESPMEGNGAIVPWAYIAIFIIAFILMTSFGRLNACVGMIAVGGWLIAAGVLIGITELFGNYSWYHGASMIVIGVFLIALGIIALLGGVEQQ